MRSARQAYDLIEAETRSQKGEVGSPNVARDGNDQKLAVDSVSGDGNLWARGDAALIQMHLYLRTGDDRLAEKLVPEALPTDDAIAETARRVLDDKAGAIYLSRLGQDLRTEFGTGFKLALGSRSLGDFVAERLSDKYEVWGKGPYKRVGPHGSADQDTAPRPRLKYLDVVWKAFSFPIEEGLRRWIDLGPPPYCVDTKEPPADDALEVPSEFVIGDGHARRERADAIASSIQRWADLNNVPLNKLEEQVRPNAKDAYRATEFPESLTALRRMIATIPDEERARYSLPLNLLGRLLQVP